MRAWIALIAAMVLATPALAQETVPTSPQQITLTFAPVVKQVAPAVVNIYTKKVVQQKALSPFFDDPFFKQFFGERFGIARGGDERRCAELRGFVHGDGGPSLQQSPHRFHVACGIEKRRRPDVIGDVRWRAALQEHLHQPRIAV